MIIYKSLNVIIKFFYIKNESICKKFIRPYKILLLINLDKSIKFLISLIFRHR